jgi:predicted alpha/beta-fold hydrolase
MLVSLTIPEVLMIAQPFKPAWWLRNSHLQTLWPAVIRKRQLKFNVELERERFELPDGDFLDLDWINKDAEGPVILVLHGFEGSVNSHYAKGMLNTIHKHGWRGVFMHFRGCSGEHNRLSRSYHSGDTSDLAYLVDTLQRREAHTPFAAIGYSLGGNVLLKWLGETGALNPLKAAIAVSVPFELKKAAKRIDHGFSRFYQWYFLRCLRARLQRKFVAVPSPIDPVFLDEVATLRDFDNAYTAPLYGYRDAEEYYEAASSRPYLRFIQVPTLLLHAKDDPFMTADVIPTASELSSSTQLEVADHGGHVGFVSGNLPWRPVYWLEERTPLFFQEFLC